MVVMSVIAGRLADFLIQSIGNRRKVRIIMELSGNLLPALLFLVLGFVTDVASAVALVTLAVATSGLAYSGYNSNMLDVCPRYAGVLFSVSNTIATSPGIIAPILTGAIVKGDKPPLSEWRIVFVIAAAVYAFGDIVWVAWCQGEPVPALNEEAAEGLPSGGSAT